MTRRVVPPGPRLPRSAPSPVSAPRNAPDAPHLGSNPRSEDRREKKPTALGGLQRPRPAGPAEPGQRILELRGTPNSSANVDGVRFCNGVLDQIRKIKKDTPNRRCVVVFDLDNTVFETRARTLAIAQDYDRERGTKHFKGLRLSNVRIDGTATAQSRGLDPGVVADFQAYWLDAFWDGANFRHDLLVQRMEKLAWKAHEAGAEVMYLTGRVDQNATLAQIIRAKLPDADEEHVITKPAIGVFTPKFKIEKMESWLEEGAFLGWFATEGRRDIAYIQKEAPLIPCLRLEHPLETDLSHVIRPDTPVLPAHWLRILTRPVEVRDRAPSRAA